MNDSTRIPDFLRKSVDVELREEEGRVMRCWLLHKWCLWQKLATDRFSDTGEVFYNLERRCERCGLIQTKVTHRFA